MTSFLSHENYIFTSRVVDEQRTDQEEKLKDQRRTKKAYLISKIVNLKEFKERLLSFWRNFNLAIDEHVCMYIYELFLF